MTESNEVQALETISNAVDDSQLKIILTTQCIKAQSLLVAKLRKQSEHQKEICNFINNGNVKLKAEIRIAEQKIKSTITALETIKSANVELQKELLLSKERSSDIVQRVDSGIKKYEKLWQEAKAKYENIPFIKHYLQTKNQNHTVKQNIDTLRNDSQKLTSDIIAKKNKLTELDRSRIIDLANYLIIERPKTLLLIKQKRDQIDEINKKISKVMKNPNERVVYNIDISKVEKPVEKEDKDKNSGLDLNKSGEDTGMVLPKLELCYIDLDLLSNKLDKIKKSDSFSIASTRIQNPIELQQNTKINDSHDDFEMILIGDNFNTHKNYSDKKLINILDDVKINDNEAKDILSKLKSSDLRDVSISEVMVATNKDDEMEAKVDERAEPIPMYIEEMDSSPKKTSIIGPPTQFLDRTERSQKSEILMVEENPTQTSTEINNSNKTDEGNILLDESKDTDNSRENDASFEKIKDSILKKHITFDLSPEFVYSKKPMTTMKSDDVVTSKFFDDKNSKNEEAIQTVNSCNVDSPCHEPMPVEDAGKDKEVNGAAQISEKSYFNNLEHKNDMPISGFLFNHGSDGIIQLSNTSLDTTGYGDGENDFPSCIDSSLLLSPKADLEIQGTGPNVEPVLSQEVPNFLSGLRKTGFSFFGSGTTDEASTSETSTKPLQSNFNFNFGGEQKKTRGGLFSMFR